MQTSIEGGSAFAYINVDLEPGESVIAESDAMSSMSSDLSMDAKFNGGFFSGLAKAYLGGESLFVNHFTILLFCAVTVSFRHLSAHSTVQVC